MSTHTCTPAPSDRTQPAFTSWDWRRPCTPAPSNRTQPAFTSWDWRRPCTPAPSNRTQPAFTSWDWRRPCTPAPSDKTQPVQLSTNLMSSIQVRIKRFHSFSILPQCKSYGAPQYSCTSCVTHIFTYMEMFLPQLC